MNFIKAPGVPLAITAFAILMGVGGTIIGIQTLIDPSNAIDFVEGADKMGLGWGGRNLGLGVVMLTAVLLRNPAGYAVGFSGVMWREVSDIIAGMSDGGSFNVMFAAVAVLEVVCLVICVRAAEADRNQAALAE